MATESEGPALTLFLSSGELPAKDQTWQRECRQLYSQIQRALDAGNVEPLRESVGPGERTGLLEFFNAFVATGIGLGGFKAMFDLSKLWLEQRQNCEITLAFPDGAQLKVSKLSHDEALALWKEHSHHFGKKRHA